MPLSFAKKSGAPQIADQARLDEILKLLRQQRTAKIELTGHTSDEGTAGANQEIGQLRADATKELLRKRGIDVGRIRTQTVGSSAPIAPNDSDEDRQKNRRVTLRLVP